MRRNKVLCEFIINARHRTGKTKAHVAKEIGLELRSYDLLEEVGDLELNDRIDLDKLARSLNMKLEDLLAKNAESNLLRKARKRR